MTDPVVRRLHECLNREIRQREIEQPVTVAEIYQEIVPYRAIRSDIGVDMNADYEHALLRLLAGEGGLVRLEPTEARDELRFELEMPDPNVTLYRKFAGCDVWVTAAARIDPGAESSAGVRPVQPATARGALAGAPAARAGAPAHAGTSPPGGRKPQEAPLAIPDWLAAIDRERPATTRPVAPSAAPIGGPPSNSAGASPAVNRSASPGQGARRSAPPAAGVAPRRPAAADAGCHQCDGRLPGNRQIRFCPHCGADQERVPCSSCGEVLEASWRYCIACGGPA